VEREIGSLSRQFGAPRIQRRRRPDCNLGDIKLQPLTKSELTILTRLEQDESPNMGFLVDYLMDFRKSARANLPFITWRDRGFVWVARYGENGNDASFAFWRGPFQMKLGALEASRFRHSRERPTESRHGAPPSTRPTPTPASGFRRHGLFVARTAAL